MKKTIKTISAFALVATLSIIAFAAVTFDSATGTGFVGKGDVQLALGLNNAQVQNATVNFTYSAETTTVSAYEWECTNENNNKIQERANTTTVSNSTTGVVSSLARVKNQITGYNLLGWSGAPTIDSNTTTDGPAINSCPNSNGTWFLSTPAADPVVDTQVTGSGLYVNGVALQ